MKTIRLPRLVSLALVATFASTTHTLVANAQQSGDQQALNAQNADIRAFIQDVSRLTGRTFVIDPAVQGSVTIASGGALTEDQIYEVFLSTLRAHGYVVLPTTSGAFRIAPDDDAARQPSAPGGERFLTQVIRLQSRDAASVVSVLEPLIGRGGQVSAAQRSNAIVITDFADNVRRLAGLVRDLDRDTDTIDILPLQNSRASVIAAALREITGAGSGGDAAGAQPFSAANFTAVDSSNSLVIRGPAEAVSRLRGIAATLDSQALPTGDTRVIFLQHANAAKMVELLNTVINRAPGLSEAPGEGPSLPGPNGNAQSAIALYDEANAIIVRGDPTIQQEVEGIVRQLDKRSDQVLVQAIVVEMSDDAARDLGVQFLLAGNENSSLPFFATPYSNASPNILALSSALLGSNYLGDDSTTTANLQGVALDALLGTAGGIAGFAGDLGGDGLFGAILNLVKRDSASNLLSTPSIMTLNNREANILVGQEVPISTGEVLSSNNNNPFRTIERKDVGIELNVTPQINSDGAITLDIFQAVSSIAPSVSSFDGEFIFNKREITTSVLVDDGEIVVLGGLLDQGERISTEKIPGLGDIPYLGRLFSSENRDKYQTNLVVFIRPVVIRDAVGARAATQTNIDRMNWLQSTGTMTDHQTLDDVLSTPLTPMPSISAAPEAVEGEEEAPTGGAQ